MRYAVRTLVEALALAAFVTAIWTLAESTLPFARSSSPRPARFVERAEAPARASSPQRAGRDAIADLIGGQR